MAAEYKCIDIKKEAIFFMIRKSETGNTGESRKTNLCWKPLGKKSILIIHVQNTCTNRQTKDIKTLQDGSFADSGVDCVD